MEKPYTVHTSTTGSITLRPPFRGPQVAILGRRVRFKGKGEAEDEVGLL
jgi:hypothetical protein